MSAAARRKAADQRLTDRLYGVGAGCVTAEAFDTPKRQDLSRAARSCMDAWQYNEPRTMHLYQKACKKTHSVVQFSHGYERIDDKYHGWN